MTGLVVGLLLGLALGLAVRWPSAFVRGVRAGQELTERAHGWPVTDFPKRRWHRGPDFALVDRKFHRTHERPELVRKH